MKNQPLIDNAWQTYDERKTTINQDPAIFCPEQLWEFNYLLDQITHSSPDLDPIMVMLAIRQATRETVAPRPRKYFIEVVMESIRERQRQWDRILNGSSQDAA